MNARKQKKINVGVLFGGKSAEHEISVKSAQNVVKALNKKKYKVSLIGIDPKGFWVPFTEEQLFSCKEVKVGKYTGDKKTARAEFLIKYEQALKKVDVIFPVLHGPFGEDGTMQGLIKTANLPFVGAGVLGSSVAMDKDVMKRLLRDAGLPIAKFLVYKKHEIKSIKFEEVEKSLGLPFFVKPANLGSSVGVAKVHNKKEWGEALTLAFSYDTKILIEEYIKGKEIECAILGNENPKASMCGEITPQHEFYSYEAKYLDNNGAIMSIPAKISKATETAIRNLALEAFTVLCCEGLARVDFFLDENNKIYINEINTMPGFTSISMYPKLWEVSGISYEKLLDTLITFALERFSEEQKLLTSFSNSTTMR